MNTILMNNQKDVVISKTVYHAADCHNIAVRTLRHDGHVSLVAEYTKQNKPTCDAHSPSIKYLKFMQSAQHFILFKQVLTNKNVVLVT
jgi:hypothetical protein